MFSPIRGLVALLVACCCGVMLPACGGSNDEASDNASVVQQQIESARKQGAREARNAERIRQLERELRKGQRTATVTKTVIEAPAPSEQRIPPSGARTSSGYIAQLGSFTSLSGAQAHAATLSSRGLDVGVLDSDDYIELRSGYWVVYSGVYALRALADSAAAEARAAGVSDAFVRAVTPRPT